MLDHLKLPTILLGVAAMAAGVAGVVWPQAGAVMSLLGLPDPGTLFLAGAAYCGFRVGQREAVRPTAGVALGQSGPIGSGGKVVGPKKAGK